MKKIVLSLATVFGLSLGAQTLTQANHSPAVGETFTRYQCDSTGITLGTSGASQFWNYASLMAHTSISSDYAARTNTNSAYNPADIVMNVMPNGDNSYFKSSATDLKYYGGNMLFGTNAVVFNFSTPAVVAVYPMSLNTANSNTIAGTMNVPSFGLSGNFNGTANLFADGTGTLVLPAKTFNDVIKVTSSQLITATLTAGTATVTQLTVDYYSVGNPKASLLTIASSTVVSIAGSNTQTVVTVLKDYTSVGINESSKADIGLTVYPNPASSVVYMSTKNTEAYKVMAYDLTGRVVVTELFENNQSKIQVSNLTAGMYLYSILSKNNQVLNSGKFNVEK